MAKGQRNCIGREKRSDDLANLVHLYDPETWYRRMEKARRGVYHKKGGIRFKKQPIWLISLVFSLIYQNVIGTRDEYNIKDLHFNIKDVYKRQTQQIG